MTGAGELARIVRGEGVVPLAWAGGTSAQDYLNLGDALSPVMVALLSGRPVRRVPFRSDNSRLVAVGTIGQNIAGGSAWFWGTGCSPRAGEGRFSPDPGLRAHVAATRGPLSATLLGAGRLATRVFGDPVWLLPRFWRPDPPPEAERPELGVIMHLSELADRSGEARPRPELARYAVPPDLADKVRLIDTVTPVSAEGLRARLETILACRRIVSTSLHGLVFAESYGIPCLPLVDGPKAGPERLALRPDSPLGPRAIDLYMGAGLTRRFVWRQPRDGATDWEALIAAIDRFWEPVRIDGDALAESLPLDLAPLTAPAEGTVWDHPIVSGLTLAHDVAALRRADAKAARTRAAAETEAEAGWRARLKTWRLPAVAAPAPPPPRLPLLRGGDGRPAIPLAWAAGPANGPRVNIGDALSPLIVAAITGLPIVQAGFASGAERLAAVGTIAHGLRGGTAHLWGTGLDAGVNPARPGEPWGLPEATTFHVHATRGPMTAEALRREGIDAPETFGDPVHLLDRLFPIAPAEPRWDLGVILHLSELDPAAGLGAAPGTPVRPRAEHIRYEIPPAFRDRVRLIDTCAAPSLAAFRAKLEEIAACRAILSTSLHGLVIAEVYGRPAAWFGFGSGGLRELDPLDPALRIDHRMRDLYAGQGRRVPAILTRRDRPSDWARLIELAGGLACIRPDSRALFDAFPGPRVVDWESPVWPSPERLVPRLG